MIIQPDCEAESTLSPPTTSEKKDWQEFFPAQPLNDVFIQRYTLFKFHSLD